MTTNGLLLDRSVERLARSGLRRVNVSLDTLDPQRFEGLTRRRVLDRVIEGIGAAVAAGLNPVKVNTVVVRGVNDDEIEEFVARARDERWELRFIEYMPLENGDGWDRSRVVPGEEIRRRIDSRWPLEADPAGNPRAPATRFRFRDGKGSVGMINSVSEPFCKSCSRLRLTADGKFRVCLYDAAEVDLKTPLREGKSDDELERIMRDALSRKGRGGALEILERQAALPLRRTMHQIGG
jgi:cyclic pyranopterin phosphate synthase